MQPTDLQEIDIILVPEGHPTKSSTASPAQHFSGGKTRPPLPMEVPEGRLKRGLGWGLSRPSGTWEDNGPTRFPPLKRWAIVNRPAGTVWRGSSGGKGAFCVHRLIRSILQIRESHPGQNGKWIKQLPKFLAQVPLKRYIRSLGEMSVAATPRAAGEGPLPGARISKGRTRKCVISGKALRLSSC